MAFSEKLKKEVRMKSDGRCVICHKPFVEIHHIIPQKQGGPDTFANAVALCAYCHDIFGDNPTKRKQLKEMRDLWYQKVKANKMPTAIEHHHHVYEKIKVVPMAKEKDEPMVATYHVVYENENFNDAANDLIEITRAAQEKAPNQRRSLYLDIDGHRLKDGAFDHDMWELQFYFILQNLLYYYTEIHMPLVTVKNPYTQLEDKIPDDFIIYDENSIPSELKEHSGNILYTYMTEDELNKLKKENKQS